MLLRVNGGVVRMKQSQPAYRLPQQMAVLLNPRRATLKASGSASPTFLKARGDIPRALQGSMIARCPHSSNSSNIMACGHSELCRLPSSHPMPSHLTCSEPLAAASGLEVKLIRAAPGLAQPLRCLSAGSSKVLRSNLTSVCGHIRRCNQLSLSLGCSPSLPGGVMNAIVNALVSAIVIASCERKCGVPARYSGPVSPTDGLGTKRPASRLNFVQSFALALERCAYEMVHFCRTPGAAVHDTKRFGLSVVLARSTRSPPLTQAALPQTQAKALHALHARTLRSHSEWRCKSKLC